MKRTTKLLIGVTLPVVIVTAAVGEWYARKKAEYLARRAAGESTYERKHPPARPPKNE